MSSAERVSSSRGRGRGLPPAEPVRVRLMLRCVLVDANGRFDMEGEALGDVDMRSWSGSSDAFRFRPDMLCGW